MALLSKDHYPELLLSQEQSANVDPCMNFRSAKAGCHTALDGWMGEAERLKSELSCDGTDRDFPAMAASENHIEDLDLVCNPSSMANSILRWEAVWDLVKDMMEDLGVTDMNQFPISQEPKSDLFEISVSMEKLRHGQSTTCADIRSCTQSFKEHVLNMHPIINREGFRAIWKDLLTMTSFHDNPSSHNTEERHDRAGATSTAYTSRKRKRSTDSREPAPAQVFDFYCWTINRALALVILALGKLCLWTSGIPAIPRSTTPVCMDGMPGFEYFRIASDIVRSQTDTPTLTYVHVLLFLGLYCGQLGLVRENMRYIKHACEVMKYLLEP